VTAIETLHLGTERIVVYSVKEEDALRGRCAHFGRSGLSALAHAIES